jgi:hypothetical protein
MRMPPSMRPLPASSKVELEILAVLWDQPSATGRAVYEALGAIGGAPPSNRLHHGQDVPGSLGPQRLCPWAALRGGARHLSVHDAGLARGGARPPGPARAARPRVPPDAGGVRPLVRGARPAECAGHRRSAPAGARPFQADRIAHRTGRAVRRGAHERIVPCGWPGRQPCVANDH